MQTVSALIVTLALSAPAAESRQGVLLDFTSKRCVPCRQMSLIVTRLERQGYPIRQVDVDREPELARKFRIATIPAFVLVINGKEVTRRLGKQPEGALVGLMARIPKTPSKSLASATKSAAPGGSAPKRSILPRFHIPLFGSLKKPKPTPVSAAADVPPVIRAKYDRSRNLRSEVARFDPLASSTRIRVRDDEGVNFGSGTIIDSRPGRTIVITCGHIFRDLKPDSIIEVDIYSGKRFETFVGRLLRYNLRADVGLVSIASDLPLSASKIASADTRIAAGDTVFSIGCGGGEPPTKQELRITALNRYNGPDNIECTGVPKMGRSGGGLFRDDGKLIGVCFGADPQDERGLYAGLKAVYQLLEEAEVGQLRGDAPIASVSGDGDVSGRATTASGRRKPADSFQQQGAEIAPRSSTVALSSKSVSAAQQSRTRSGLPASSTVPDTGPQAEVICIIRPLGQPRSASRVVIINRASSRFLSYLEGELEQQPRPTSERMPTTAPRPVIEQTIARFVDPMGPATRNLGWRTTQPHRPKSKQNPTPNGPQRYRRSAASRN